MSEKVEYTPIAHVLAGASDLNIIGEVIDISPPREVISRRAREQAEYYDTSPEGKLVQNILLRDKTGVLNIALWGEEVNEVDLAVGQTLDIRDAHTYLFDNKPCLSFNSATCYDVLGVKPNLNNITSMRFIPQRKLIFDELFKAISKDLELANISCSFNKYIFELKAGGQNHWFKFSGRFLKGRSVGMHRNTFHFSDLISEVQAFIKYVVNNRRFTEIGSLLSNIQIEGSSMYGNIGGSQIRISNRGSIHGSNTEEQNVGFSIKGEIDRDSMKKLLEILRFVL